MGNEEVNAIKIDAERFARKKRVNRIKKIIIVAIIVLILIPIVLCIGLIIKVNKLEQQVETLAKTKTFEYEDYLDNTDNSKSSTIAYAAEAKDTQKDSDNMDRITEEAITPEEKLDLETKENKIYLTFDDGPGSYTDELLDILKEYNVKATFFVIGKTDEHARSMYKRIVEEGHILAMHSYSHQYSKIYKSVSAFKDDLNQLKDLLYETTGVEPTLFRFPGGSSNTVSAIPMSKFIHYLNKEHITYYDWNVVNGDASGKDLTKNELVKNVLNGVKKNNNSIVLMHDSVSRDTTVKSLPKLIKKLRKENYVILPITKYTNTIQHIKADSVK